MKSRGVVFILSYLISFFVFTFIAAILIMAVFPSGNFVRTIEDQQIGAYIHRELHIANDIKQDLIKPLGPDRNGNNQFLYCIPSQNNKDWIYAVVSIEGEDLTENIHEQNIRLNYITSDPRINATRLLERLGK